MFAKPKNPISLEEQANSRLHVGIETLYLEHPVMYIWILRSYVWIFSLISRVLYLDIDILCLDIVFLLCVTFGY